MNEDMVARLLIEQRKRMIAGILGAAEQAQWWGKLNAAEQRAHREKVLSSVGVFYDFCRDVIKISNDDTVRNDYAIDLIRQVHAGQQKLQRQLTHGE